MKFVITDFMGVMMIFKKDRGLRYMVFDIIMYLRSKYFGL